MKHLEYWEVLDLLGKKDKLLTFEEPLMTLGIEQIGKFRMERMQGIMKDLVEHTQVANGTIVLQT